MGCMTSKKLPEEPEKVSSPPQTAPKKNSDKRKAPPASKVTKLKKKEEKKEKTDEEVEREINELIDSEQKKLRSKTRPLLDRKASVQDSKALGIIDHWRSSLTDEDRHAMVIQKYVRRHLAKSAVQARQDWLIFCNVDSTYEALKITQASKMMDQQPNSPGTNKVSINLEEDETIDQLLTGIARRNTDSNIIRIKSEAFADTKKDKSDEGIEIKRANSMVKFLRLEKAILGDFQNYNIPPQTIITQRHILDVNEVYKRGGKLTIGTVHKICRQSYRILKSKPNITRVHLSYDSRLTVVGDLHGQLEDLFHILKESGFPSPKNKYIFNGDFVDRGSRGLEVICLLLLHLIVFPEYVILNRGNHEDFAVCCLYGFQSECCSKYDEVTFGMFSEVFQHLPLFAVVNNSVFVVHGGIFHDEQVTLEDLDAIDRSNFSLKEMTVQDIVEDGVSSPLRPKSDSVREAESIDAPTFELPSNIVEDVISPIQNLKRLKRLQADALWSDPRHLEGMGESARGVGVLFGPDVTRRFLNRTGLHMVVRSHECVQTGFDKPYLSTEEADSLVTIFSASNYGGGGNSGAYLRFVGTPYEDFSQVPDTDLWYRAHSFLIPPELNAKDNDNSESSSPAVPLHELITLRVEDLRTAFKKADEEKKGEVSKLIWANIMQKTTELKIRWLTLVPYLVDEEHRKSGDINYEAFLAPFEPQPGRGRGPSLSDEALQGLLG